MATSPKLNGPAELIGALAAGGEFARAFTGNGFGARIVAKGSGGVAGGEIQVYGTSKDSDDPLDWYPLGDPMVFAADGSQTIYLDEPNTYVVVRADVYAAGSFDIELQRLS